VSEVVVTVRLNAAKLDRKSKHELITLVLQLCDINTAGQAEIERLLAAIFANGESPVEARQACDPVAYLQTRYVTVTEYNELAEKTNRLQAELDATRKAQQQRMNMARAMMEDSGRRCREAYE
jgi:hypothetical protein